MNILILCTGNTCRSQMAHGFMKSFDSRLKVYSAGVNPSRYVQPETIEVMAEKGIDLSSHTPHHVDDYVHTNFDYVITVCDHADATCPTFLGDVKHRMHMPFPDPFSVSGGRDMVYRKYRQIRDDIEKAFRELYKTQIREQL